MKMKKLPWQTLACCAVLGFSSTAFGSLICGAGDYANCYTNSTNTTPNNFKGSWQVSGNSLNVNIQAETTGWIAIGFHDNAVATTLMDDTDFVMGGYNGSTYGGDYFYTSTGTGCPNCAPSLDATQNITGLTATESGGVTSLSFSRLLNTGDTVGDFNLSSGNFDILWAFRNPNATNGDDLTRFHSGGRGILASNVQISAVPLPATVWLFGTAMLGLIASGKRRIINR